jgi:hypothetical protein
MKLLQKILIACLLVTLNSGVVQAHDFWLEPDNFTPEKDQQVSIRLKEGVGFRGDTLPYIEEWFNDFSAVTAAGREPVTSLTGNDPAAEITADSGAILLGYQSNRSFVDLAAKKFNQYLEDEGIEFIRAARIAAGEDDLSAPEYFIRCAKALIQPIATKSFLQRFFSSGNSSGNKAQEIYKSNLGYTLELIPAANPYDLNPGDSLTFELLYRGKPIEGLQVQAFTREHPDEAQKIRTNEAGLATVRFDKAGTWMVKAVQIQAIIGDPKARWQSYWATYLFTVD